LEVLLNWVYVGVVKPRISGKRVYLHLNPRVVDAIGTRYVIVRAVLEPVGDCKAKLPLGDLVFKATLIRVNGTYRVTIPAKLGRVLAGLAPCVTLHVSIAPVFR
jgi:hypothetical protein